MCPATRALEGARSGQISPAVSPGGAKWLWWSRLALDDAALGAIIHDPQVHVFAVADRAGVEVGMLELDFRKAGEAEIAFFGLIPGATGKGFGKWLMRRALQMAWGDKELRGSGCIPARSTGRRPCRSTWGRGSCPMPALSRFSRSARGQCARREAAGRGSAAGAAAGGRGCCLSASLTGRRSDGKGRYES
jgi:GNAT superfamily N-acetyltransferase